MSLKIISKYTLSIFQSLLNIIGFTVYDIFIKQENTFIDSYYNSENIPDTIIHPDTNQPYVLNKEIEMTKMFEELIKTCVQHEEIELSPEQIYLLAHNIIVHGQMWAFRRWGLRKTYTLDQYIELQTDMFLSGLVAEGKALNKGDVCK